MRTKGILKTIIKLFLPTCYKVCPALKSIKYYRDSFGRTPNFVNPKTFNEKVLLKIIFDRNPKLTLFADKVLVRDFVKSKLRGEEHLTKLYAVVKSPAEISNLNLPKQFVMKPNHLSGQIKIVYDKEMLATDELEKLAAVWLEKNHHRLYGEWAYKNIQPLIFFEELLETEDKIPDDYKFFCFNGEPQFIQIDRNRFTNHKRNIYDLNFSLLPVQNQYENFHDDFTAPPNFIRMIEVARKLSAGADFVRVDLYNINGRIAFGELTNYPGAGQIKFVPHCGDVIFGSFWK